MKKNTVYAFILILLLGLSSQLFAKSPFIPFPQNKEYPNMFQFTESESNDIWGVNHSNIKDYYEKFMNKAGHSKGYLYDIALPGNGTGKVILMPGMGKKGEISSYMLSTSEAMGYGMIMAAIMGDKETFDGLWKTCQYYEAYNPETDSFNKHLTSWTIPGKKGTYLDGYVPIDEDKYNAASDEDKKKMLKNIEWKRKYHLPQPQDDKGQNVTGPHQVIQGHEKTKDECRWSATDGDQDIAYALLMGHWQWEDHAPGDGIEAPYLGASLAIYKEISKNIIVEVEGSKNLMHLRTGDYFEELNHSKPNHTRPCDWTLTHYRTAFENIGDQRYRDLNHSLYDYMFGDHPLSDKKLMPDFGWMDFKTGKLREAKNNESENPEHIKQPTKVGDYYQWLESQFPNTLEGKVEWISAQKWTPAGVLSDAYNWNACRYPWRVGLDAIHYQDHRSFKETKKVADALYNSYGSKSDGSAHGIHQLPMGTTLNADAYLKQFKKNDDSLTDIKNIKFDEKDAKYTTSAFNAPYLFAYAVGRTESEIKNKADYIKAIKACLGDFVSIEPSWCEESWENDPHTNSNDLYYSGYFEDSINLLSMMALAGDWWKPHGWKNDFRKGDFEASNAINEWILKTANGVSATHKVIEKNGSKVLEINVTKVPDNPSTFDLKLIQEDIDLRDQSGYGFSMNVGREGLEGVSCKVDVELSSGNGVSKLSDKNKDLIINQNDFSYYSGHIPAMKDGKWPGNIVKTKITIGLGHELKVGKYYIDNLGIFDPERSITNKYLYIGPWESDPNPADETHIGYYKGDVVRYQRKTYVCIKDHEIATNENRPGNTEYWEETTDVNLGPEWVSGDSYLKETIVMWQGIAYICKYSHSNSIYDPFTDTTNWMIYYDPYEGQAPRWAEGIQYKPGDIVRYNGYYYRCITQHKALSSWTPNITYTLWEKDLTPFRPDPTPETWEVNVAYQLGDIILYKGKKYTCIIAHTAYPGWEPDQTAALWQ